MKIIDFFIPPACLICSTLTTQAHQLCLNCFNKINWIKEPSCIKCCTKFDFALLQGATCQNCEYNQWSFNQLIALASYDPVAARVAVKLKYQGLGAKFIANQLFDKIKNLQTNFHLITYVPLHTQRIIKRGFNQAELIAKQLSLLMHIPVKSLLIRIKNTLSQDGLGQKERMSNLQNAFAINPKINPLELHNINVLLIDDVVTTNATIENCSHVLTQYKSNVYPACWSKRILHQD